MTESRVNGRAIRRARGQVTGPGCSLGKAGCWLRPPSSPSSPTHAHRHLAHPGRLVPHHIRGGGDQPLRVF